MRRGRICEKKAISCYLRRREKNTCARTKYLIVFFCFRTSALWKCPVTTKKLNICFSEEWYFLKFSYCFLLIFSLYYVCSLKVPRDDWETCVSWEGYFLKFSNCFLLIILVFFIENVCSLKGPRNDWETQNLFFLRRIFSQLLTWFQIDFLFLLRTNVCTLKLPMDDWILWAENELLNCTYVHILYCK